LIHRFKAAGLDFIDVSMGFSTPAAAIPWGPAFMAPVATRIRRETGLPTATSWFISEPAQADGLVRDGAADVVMLGRSLLADPHWPYRAARELGVDDAAWVLPAPYAHWLARYRTA
jgi:2,4-dienoyl-CoA reductase-like NADH-dependent reductase (Old Yellow Enzyme family)